MVLPVGLQGPHKLPCAAPGQDVVRGAVSNQRLALVELAVGRAVAGDAVVELPGSGELLGRVRSTDCRRWSLQGRICEPCAEIRGLAPASAARRIASRCIHDMISRCSPKNVRTVNALCPDEPKDIGTMTGMTKMTSSRLARKY